MRVLDSPQQRLKYIFEITVNALSEKDRPQHQDHYPALFDKCVGSFKSLHSVERLGLHFNVLILTLSVPFVLLYSPNFIPYLSLNKFERILFLIFKSLLCLINSRFLITKCLILYVLCEEKLSVDN